MRVCAGTRRRSHEQIFYTKSSCPLCQEMLLWDDMMEQRDDLVRELNKVKAHNEQLKWSKVFVGASERGYVPFDEA